MSDYTVNVQNRGLLLQLRFSREAAEAAARLLDAVDHYPGLKFVGNKESYEKLKHDIELVSEEYSELFLTGTKGLRDSIQN